MVDNHHYNRYRAQYIYLPVPVLICFGHKSSIVTISKKIEMICNKGTNGLNTLRAILVPKIVNGNKTQAGQIKAPTPRRLAMLLDRFVPTGQVPKRRCQLSKPVVILMSIIRLTAKIYSEIVGSGRGNE